MTNTIYLTPTDRAAKPAIALMKKAYPTYRGRRFRIRVDDTPLNVRSSWDGGSRDYFTFVNLATGDVGSTVGAQSAFDPTIPGAEQVALPLNVGCVEHSITQGRDCGLTLVIRSTHATTFLPAPDRDLTTDQSACLLATASLKNTYGGRTNIRQQESGLTQNEWSTAQVTLIAKNLLTKSGSITPNGRNAIANHPDRDRRF